MFSNEKLSDEICHRTLTFFKEYQSKPDKLETERGIKLQSPLTVYQEEQHIDVVLMSSIARNVVKEYEKKYTITVSWKVYQNNDNQVVFEITEITGNKWH